MHHPVRLGIPLSPVLAAILGFATALGACPRQRGAAEPSTSAQAAPRATTGEGPTTTGAASAPAHPSSQPSKASSQPGAALEKGTSPETREQVDPDGIVRRGAALSSLAALTVDECVSKVNQLDNSTVKVTGEVASVCQAKGCWMVLRSSSGEQIRITAMDYGFFLPRGSKGSFATVEGRLKTEVLDVETAQHLEDESGRIPPRRITEPVRELVITATGVELSRRAAG